MSPITQTPIPLSDEWATPRGLYGWADAKFGPFTHDACAMPWNAKHPNYVSRGGLEVEYGPGDVVWCNPPYSALPEWMSFAYRQSQRGAVFVCLVPITPDRYWWSDYVEEKAELIPLTRSVLPSGRVHFEKEDGTSGRAPFPSCFLIYRPVNTPRRLRPSSEETP